MVFPRFLSHKWKMNMLFMGKNGMNIHRSSFFFKSIVKFGKSYLACRGGDTNPGVAAGLLCRLVETKGVWTPSMCEVSGLGILKRSRV